MNKGFTIKAMLILVAVIAGFSAFAFPRYFWEKEKARAEVMDVVLSHAELAQDYFIRLNGRPSSDWSELKKYFVLPRLLNVHVREVEGTPAELYLAFIGPNNKPEADGFILRLEPAAQLQEPAFISSRRIGGRYNYQLIRPMFASKTICEGQDEKSERFCELFSSYLIQTNYRFVSFHPHVQPVLTPAAAGADASIVVPGIPVQK